MMDHVGVKLGMMCVVVTRNIIIVFFLSQIWILFDKAYMLGTISNLRHQPWGGGDAGCQNV